MQTISKMWIHVIWATKHRQPMLRKDFREQVFEHITERAGQEGIFMRVINGTEDHLHCLFRWFPKHTISTVINRIKGGSSHWINTQNFLRNRFAWQKGYSAFSVSESLVEDVRRYILKQESHHRKLSYAEEIEYLLDLHGVERQ